MRVRAEPIYATLLPVAEVQKAIHDALDETGKKMDEKFGKTTSAWAGIKPKMGHEVEIDGEAAVSSGPRGTEDENAKWIRLDVGVGRRDIVARRGPYMKFLWQGRGRSYTASTSVRSFSSRQRVKHGKWRKTPIVDHPGHEAREWSDEMANQEAGPMGQRIQKAIDGALG